MEKVYNVTQFAEMIGKSVKTLQKWDRDGILKAYRSPSNRGGTILILNIWSTWVYRIKPIRLM